MNETKLLLLDLIVTIIFFSFGCTVGKQVMENTAYTWWNFTLPTVGILVAGELIWMLIRRQIISRTETQNNNDSI